MPFVNRIFRWGVVCGLALCLTAVQAARAQTPLRLGILGDSGQDEYQGTDNRGGDFHAVTFNWVEQLILAGRVDMGVWGDYAEPRRTGYAANWARSGATADDMIAAGQHTGLAEQIAVGEIDVVVIAVGSNDFAPYRANGYGPIYGGTVSGEALDEKINGLVEDVATAIDTLQAAGDVPIIVATVPNWGDTPLVLGNPDFADPERRQLVTDAVQTTNVRLSETAAGRGVEMVDLDSLYASLIGRIDGGKLVVGHEPINLFGVGDAPHNGVLGDGIHGGTVLEGLLANWYLEAINAATGAGLELLSDDTILAFAGLSGDGVSVSSSNQAPVANDDAFSIGKGQSLTIIMSDLLANDSDPDGDALTIIRATLPEHGTLTATADVQGGIYTPNADFTGIETLTYTISDDKGATADGVVTIRVE
ncbi:MAG: cadherin-like domain-containing protein [Anaerolineae bacterium]|nr:cadherin-like domain-containing protein [Anaerolineae bacterium]